jgi:hypothetical protein
VKNRSASVQNNAAGARVGIEHTQCSLAGLIDLCERVHVLDIMEEFLSNRTSCFFASAHPSFHNSLADAAFTVNASVLTFERDAAMP